MLCFYFFFVKNVSSMLNKYSLKHNEKLSTFSNFEFSFLLNKSLFYNRRLSRKLRSYMYIHCFPKGKTTIRSRCVINNRSRAVYSKLNISRIL